MRLSRLGMAVLWGEEGQGIHSVGKSTLASTPSDMAWGGDCLHYVPVATG
jgi:hypothetical protein